MVGNYAEEKQLLKQMLTLERGRRDDYRVTLTLHLLSYVNQILGLRKEGTQQVGEAFEIFRRLGKMKEQANCLDQLAWLLLDDSQLGAAEDTVFRKIKLLPEKGREFQLCQSHHLLGKIYRSKREKEKSIHHLEAALTIASPVNSPTQLFWIHHDMAQVFCDQGQFNNATAHAEQAKLHTADNPYNLACGMELQALIWDQQLSWTL